MQRALGAKAELTLLDALCRNKALLSFGAEPEEPMDDSLAKTKFKSAHDALDDERLSKRVLDDRGTSATLPPGMEGPPKRRREESEPKKDMGVSWGCARTVEDGSR